MIENKNRNAEEAKSIQVAEESRELDWKSKSFIGSIFMGDLDMSLAYPWPEQPEADRAEGDAVLEKVRAWCDEHLDGDAIDKSEQIPAHVFQGLNELGLWGIKIPKEYGGLGLSQTNYVRILGLVGQYCGSVVSTLSAHQSIGVPQPLKLFGTPEQKKKYLPRCANGAISAFALTEPTVGSDPANMQTRAELNEAGTHWVLNGEKLWCTNGVIADVIVVMARTPSIQKNGREVKQITAFIVEADWPGVEVVHRCRFMGIRAIENGILRFNDVQIPVENVIGGEGRGLKLALTTLNDGRLGIPAVAAGTAQAIADYSARWAATRHQWGKHIGEHEAGADKLAFISGAAYAMDTLAAFGAALSDRKDVDIRMEAATAKMYNSEVGCQVNDVALQLRGGRGFETEASLLARGESAFPMERALRDSRINRIVEGTTDVMHLFLAREALDKHLQIAGGFFKRGGIGSKIKTALQAGVFYAGWLPRTVFGGMFRSYPGFDSRLAAHLKWVDGKVRKLSLTLFGKMLTQGPKLEMRQLTLARIVDLGAELAVMALVASRAQSELNRGQADNLGRALYWLAARRHVVDQLFNDIADNADAEARRLAADLMRDAEPLQGTAVELTPMAREYGAALTSGNQTERLVHAPAAADQPTTSEEPAAEEVEESVEETEPVAEAADPLAPLGDEALTEPADASDDPAEEPAEEAELKAEEASTAAK